MPSGKLKSTGKPWIQDDDRLLGQLYGTIPLSDIMKIFIGRSQSSIKNRACILHITAHDDSWTPNEITELVELYNSSEGKRNGAIKRFSVKVGRHHANVSRKARELGLKVGRHRTPGFSSKDPKVIQRRERLEWSEEERAEFRSKIQRDIRAKYGPIKRNPLYVPSIETRQKLSLAGQKGGRYVRSEETRQKISDLIIQRLTTKPEHLYSRSHRGKRPDLNDQFFRSGYEANYARFLNFQNILWEYEVKTFWFENIKRGVRSYTPDFWCPGLNEFHEVKGWMDAKSTTKLKRMKKYYPLIRVIVIDESFFKDIERKKLCLLIKGWECQHAIQRNALEQLVSKIAQANP